MGSLERQIRRNNERVSIKGQLQQLQHTLELKDAQILYERNLRAQAQRGLVVYVKALEEFNRRLHVSMDHIEDDMRDLGLWDVKLGYDPDTDPEIIAMKNGS